MQSLISGAVLGILVVCVAAVTLFAVRVLRRTNEIDGGVVSPSWLMDVRRVADDL